MLQGIKLQILQIITDYYRTILGSKYRQSYIYYRLQIIYIIFNLVENNLKKNKKKIYVRWKFKITDNICNL